MADSNRKLNLKTALDKAEVKARQRDQIDLEIMNMQERKANEHGYTIIKARQRHPAKFVQAIVENIELLISQVYLTTSEKAFIFDLMPFVQMNTHAIVDPHTGQFFSVSELARRLSRSRPKTSVLIEGLIRKGVMFEFVNVLELKNYGRSVTERPFFITPEIICSGDKNKIDAGIAELIIHHSVLKKMNLPWKLVREVNGKYGKLILNAIHQK